MILAAVIGTFVLGIGSSQQSAPQLSLGFEYDAEKPTPPGRQVTVVHEGGDTLNSENTGGLSVALSGTVNQKRRLDDDVLPYSSGEAIVLPRDVNGVPAGAGIPPDTTVEIVWEAPGGGKTSTIGSYTTA